MLLARILVLFLVPAGCSSMSVASSARVAADPFGLPPPSAPLEFPPEPEEITLAWLVQELGRLTGQEVTIHPQLLQILQQTDEPLELRTPVPADEVYAFVEGLLVNHGVYLAPLKGGTRPVLGIYGGVHARPDLGARPVVVSTEHLDALEGHPALLCAMLLEFENVDTRQLQTQLRQILVDQTGAHQVIPCGERTLLLQGYGARLAGLARILRDVDRGNDAPRMPAPEADSSPGTPPQPPPR